MKKFPIIFVSILAMSLFGVCIIRFVFSGDEDTWICTQNQWVKHGHPSSPMPVKGCGSSKQSPVSSYDSEQADLHVDLRTPLYVTESLTQEEGWKKGSIVISLHPGGDQEISNMTIFYGIPTMNGKGGACPPDGYKTEQVFGQNADVCDSGRSFFAGYPKHPEKKIEYSIFIGGNAITDEEFQTYKTILFSGIRFLHK